MNNLNINKLYYFYVVASAGSIKAASRRLHLTQPTISKQVKELEEDLGFDLFVREHRRLRLNRNGEVIFKKAEKIFRLADDLVSSLPDMDHSQRTELRIGSLKSVSQSFIYDFSTDLWKDEHIVVKAQQGLLGEMIKRLERGQLDIVLMDGPYARSQKFRSTLLGQDEVVVVASKGFQFNKRQFPKGLDRRAFIAPIEDGVFREDIDQFFRRESVRPELVGEVDDMTLMRTIVEEGECFAILPKRSAKDALKLKKLKVLGDIPSIQHGVWAVTSPLSGNRTLINRVIRDYFKRPHN